MINHKIRLIKFANKTVKFAEFKLFRSKLVANSSNYSQQENEKKRIDKSVNKIRLEFQRYYCKHIELREKHT